MAWDRNLTNLRNTLAGLYWTPVEARRIAQEAGLNPAFLRFSEKPVNMWHSVIEEAQAQQKVTALIEKARAEYPEVQVLELAQHNLLRDVEAGEIEASIWKGPGSGGELEKIIGQLSTLRPIHFLEAGLAASESVCRIILPDGSAGTGFLVENNFLLTSNHVIRDSDEARGCRVEFNFQKTRDNRNAQSESFSLAPDHGFFSSPPEENNGDDWTAVRVGGDANARWGGLLLHPADPKTHQEVIIIQHPGGGEKQIALSHNLLVFVNEKRLQYLTDTLSGSSGSPVFDTDWRLVGIHHKGGWLREPGSKSAYFRNQAININLVVQALSEQSEFNLP